MSEVTCHEVRTISELRRLGTDFYLSRPGQYRDTGLVKPGDRCIVHEYPEITLSWKWTKHFFFTRETPDGKRLPDHIGTIIASLNGGFWLQRREKP